MTFKNHHKNVYRITKRGKKSNLVAEAYPCTKTRPRFYRYFAWSRSLSADVVDILREHAHSVDFWLSWGSRFCRYFAWSRSFLWFLDKRGKQMLSLFCVITLTFVISKKVRKADVVAILRDHAPVLDTRLTCYLRSVICGYTGEAEFVAILRDHAPIYNSRLSSGSRYCRYFAWSRHF